MHTCIYMSSRPAHYINCKWIESFGMLCGVMMQIMQECTIIVHRLNIRTLYLVIILWHTKLNNNTNMPIWFILLLVFNYIVHQNGYFY